MQTQVRDFLQAVFGGLSDGVAVAEADGAILYLNSKAESILGVDCDRARGASICGLLCGHFRSASMTDDCAAACPLRDKSEIPAVTHKGGHGPAVSYDWKNFKIRRQEEWRPLRVRCQRFPLPELGLGEEKHLVIMEDVSAEAALEREHEDWRSMVAHDLRTPLTNVLGTLHVLAEIPPGRPLEPKESELAQKAAASCRRLLELLNLFLDIARLESGAAEPERHPVALQDLIEGCVQEQEAVARLKGIEVRVDAPRELFALADRELLMRVLENLVGNALKFTPPGGRVGVAARAASEWTVALAVDDNGPGIEASELPDIFERFQRARVQRRSGVPGTGLGLAFCRRAARAMGGEIFVESKPGAGSVFTVTLPAARGASA